MAWQIEYFDEFHVSQGQVPNYAIGRNDVDLRTQIDLLNNLFLSSLPANWTIEPTYPNDAMTIYFLLDKDSLMITIQAFAANFVLDVINNVPPAFPLLVNPKETPRKTGWTDPAGVKRVPPPSERKKRPDFRGAGTLLQALAALPELAANLTKIGKIREAGIVIYAYEQVLRQTWTITQAFTYLIDNRIIAANG